MALSERRPWWAAGAACLAGLTRPDGAAIGLAVLVWCLMQPERRWLRTVALVAVSEAGFVAFSIFLWARFGSPTEEFAVQKFWMRHLTWPFHPLVWSMNQVFGAHLTGPAAGNLRAVYLLDDLSVVLAVAGLAVLIAMARHQRDLGGCWPRCWWPWSWWWQRLQQRALSRVRRSLRLVHGAALLLPARFGNETTWTVTSWPRRCWPCSIRSSSTWAAGSPEPGCRRWPRGGPVRAGWTPPGSGRGGPRPGGRPPGPGPCAGAGPAGAGRARRRPRWCRAPRRCTGPGW